MEPLRKQLEAAPDNIYKDNPVEGVNSDDRYALAIQIMAKYFLKGLDRLPNFDSNRNWTESGLANFIWEEVKGEVPDNLKAELSGNQMGMAAHMAYQAYLGN